jgi:hypothetical protein
MTAPHEAREIVGFTSHNSSLRVKNAFGNQRSLAVTRTDYWRDR